jgi:hypothetical protein
MMLHNFSLYSDRRTAGLFFCVEFWQIRATPAKQAHKTNKHPPPYPSKSQFGRKADLITAPAESLLLQVYLAAIAGGSASC